MIDPDSILASALVSPIAGAIGWAMGRAWARDDREDAAADRLAAGRLYRDAHRLRAQADATLAAVRQECHVAARSLIYRGRFDAPAEGPPRRPAAAAGGEG